MFYYPNNVHITNYEAAENLLDEVLPLKPDALILANDEATMWCYHVLNDRKIAVPKQISLVSGDLWKFGKAFNPSLTGIEYDYEGIAQCCVKTIMENINKTPQEIAGGSLRLFTPQLHLGKSCCMKK